MIEVISGFDFQSYASFYRRVRSDIFEWCKVLNFEPTWQQADIFKAYNAGVEQMSIASGQGGGKTAAEVILGTHRGFSIPMSRGRVVATSMNQLLDTWMPEVRLQLGKAPAEIQQIFEIRTKDIRLFGQIDWNIVMVTAAKPENLQGRHNDHLYFIIDEASGVARPMYEVIEGTMTQVNGSKLFYLFGNPNARDTYFFDTHNKFRHRWWCYTLNCEESPIANKALHEALAEQYGRDSDVYRVRVLGLFPKTDPNTLFNSEDLEACAKTDKFQMMKLARGERQFGIDFARMGSDESVIMRRAGNAIVEWAHFDHTEPAQVIAEAFRMQKEAGWSDKNCLYVPDADGIGGGCMSYFYEPGKTVFEFHNGSSPNDPIFADKATEAYFYLSMLVKNLYCHIPDDPLLFEQLTSRQYTINAKGKLKLEPKEHYRKRRHGSLSPDRADALAMAFYTTPVKLAKIATAETSKYAKEKSRVYNSVFTK